MVLAVTGTKRKRTIPVLGLSHPSANQILVPETGPFPGKKALVHDRFPDPRPVPREHRSVELLKITSDTPSSQRSRVARHHSCSIPHSAPVYEEFLWPYVNDRPRNGRLAARLSNSIQTGLTHGSLNTFASTVTPSPSFDPSPSTQS